MRGGGQLLLIAGEAGVGKSRLVTEATAYATTHGCSVLHGACFPHAAASPYLLVLDLLRTHIIRPTLLDPVSVDDPLTRELVQLLPGMLPLSPDLVTRPAAPRRVRAGRRGAPPAASRSTPDRWSRA